MKGNTIMIKYSRIGSMSVITLKLNEKYSEERLSAIITQMFSYLEDCDNGAIIADCRNSYFDLNDLGKYRLLNQVRRYQRATEIKCVILVTPSIISSCNLRILNQLNQSENICIAIARDVMNAFQWLGIKQSMSNDFLSYLNDSYNV